MTSKKTLGDKGENFVAQWLKNKSFKIIAQNYKTKYGEIDIIAQKDVVLAFIEVKTRKTKYFPISNVVNYTKQKKIINASLKRGEKELAEYIAEKKQKKT